MVLLSTEFQKDLVVHEAWGQILTDYFFCGGSLPFAYEEFTQFAELVARSLAVSFPGFCPIVNDGAQQIVQEFLARCPMPQLNVPASADQSRLEVDSCSRSSAGDRSYKYQISEFIRIASISIDPRIDDAVAEYSRIASPEFGGTNVGTG